MSYYKCTNCDNIEQTKHEVICWKCGQGEMIRWETRLTGSRCYLCGPIDPVPDRGTIWRDNITPFLRDLGIIVINPCKKPINGITDENDELLRKLDMYTQKERWDDLAKIMREIRNTDLRCVDISDWIIAHIDTTVVMTGTMEEIFLANQQKKPVLIHCEQTLRDVPRWLWGTLPKELIFDDWNKLKDYIKHIDEADKIDHLRRWTFFNYKEMLSDIGFYEF